MNASHDGVADRNLYDVLARIERRPGMYLCTPTLTGLETFIMGYDHALIVHRTFEELEPPFHEFSEWLLRETGISSAPHDQHWATTLRNLEADEEKALTLFFHYLRAFRGTDPPARSAALAG